MARNEQSESTTTTKKKYQNQSIGLSKRVVRKLDFLVVCNQNKLIESGINAKVSRQIILEGMINIELGKFGIDDLTQFDKVK